MILINGLPVPTTVFPDNTSQVWKLDETLLRETNWVLITWQFSHEGEFMQLAQLKDLLDEYNFGAALKITYLPYGRQDKEVSNNATFALRTFATQLNTLAFKEIIIQDPHSEIALQCIKNSRAVYPKSEVAKVTRDECIGVVCYPDKGALEKYSKIYDYNYIYGEKVRDQLTGNILSYKLVGDCVGKNVLIVDDICDGGMTFKLLAKDLLAAGANSVVLFVTHGIFSKGVRTLLESGISRVFTAGGEVGPRFLSADI